MRRRVSRGVESARRRRRRGQIEAPKSPPRLKILLENTTNSYRVPLARPFFRSLLRYYWQNVFCFRNTFCPNETAVLLALGSIWLSRFFALKLPGTAVKQGRCDNRSPQASPCQEDLFYFQKKYGPLCSIT